MFAASDADGAVPFQMPSMLQWIKAGIGFTVGAGIASIFGLAFYVFVVLPIYVRVLLGMLAH